MQERRCISVQELHFLVKTAKVDRYAEKWLQKSINSRLEKSKAICDEEKFSFIVYMIIFPVLQFIICILGVAYISYFESGIHGRLAGQVSLANLQNFSDLHFQFRNKYM